LETQTHREHGEKNKRKKNKRRERKARSGQSEKGDMLAMLDAGLYFYACSKLTNLQE